mgnify:CR=1 FL=1
MTKLKKSPFPGTLRARLGEEGIGFDEPGKLVPLVQKAIEGGGVINTGELERFLTEFHFAFKQHYDAAPVRGREHYAAWMNELAEYLSVRTLFEDAPVVTRRFIDRALKQDYMFVQKGRKPATEDPRYMPIVLSVASSIRRGPLNTVETSAIWLRSIAHRQKTTIAEIELSRQEGHKEWLESGSKQRTQLPPNSRKVRSFFQADEVERVQWKSKGKNLEFEFEPPCAVTMDFGSQDQAPKRLNVRGKVRAVIEVEEGYSPFRLGTFSCKLPNTIRRVDLQLDDVHVGFGLELGVISVDFDESTKSLKLENITD